MSDIPDNIDLNWIGRRVLALQDDTRTLRANMDMLIPLAVRMDHTLDAVREDIRSLWTGQGDLRRRVEALEQRERRETLRIWMAEAPLKTEAAQVRNASGRTDSEHIRLRGRITN